MKQRQLGPNGPFVGEIGLGGMPLSLKEDRPSEAEGAQVLLAAFGVGMNFWDTADAYCWDDSETGHNERVFALAYSQMSPADREKLIIATKGGHVRPNGEWKQNGRPEHLRAAIDASLERLGLEQIPLYQLHRVDPNVAIEDSLAPIVEAKNAGKIAYIGLSNVSVAQIEAALKLAPIASVQNRYSLEVRDPENDGVLDFCARNGISFLPWSPLGGIGAAKDKGVSAAQTLAAEIGVSPQQVALAWLLSKDAKLIPIPGVSRAQSALDSAQAGEITLSAQQLKQLEA